MAGGGGGGSGGGDGGYGGFGSTSGYGGGMAGSLGGVDFGGMGGQAVAGPGAEFIGWRDLLGQLYPWEIEPGDTYGIPKAFAAHELEGRNLRDTRGYMDRSGQSYLLNPNPISAMIPDMRGGERLDPRFVGFDRRNEALGGALGARGFADLGPRDAPNVAGSFSPFMQMRAAPVPFVSPSQAAAMKRSMFR